MQSASSATSAQPDNLRNVLCFSNLPSGLESAGLRAWLSQFGRVNAIAFRRSPKTGRPVGLAFASMANPRVAELIAAKFPSCMLFHKRMRIRLTDIPPDKFKALLSTFRQEQRIALRKDLLRAKLAKLAPADTLSSRAREKLERAGVVLSVAPATTLDLPALRAEAQTIRDRLAAQRAA